MQPIRIVAVGDGATGKTCAFASLTYNGFPEDYYAQHDGDFSSQITVKGKTFPLTLIDTRGQEEYDRLRPLSYPQADIFLIFSSIISPVSLENVKSKWVPEIKHFRPDALFILVGAKQDLRYDPETISHLAERGVSLVTPEDGEAMAKDVGAIKYIECSALTQRGLHSVFEEAARAFLKSKKKTDKKHKNCAFQ